MLLDRTYETIGEAGMKIRIGGVFDGVCIDSWHMNTRDKTKLNTIVSGYKNAKKKAQIIQKVLKSL